MTTNATPRRTTRALTAIKAHPRRVALTAGITVLTVGGLLFALPSGVAASPAACETAVQAYIDDFVEHGTQDPSIDAAKLACSTVPPAQVQIIAQAVWDANGKSLATAAVAQVFDGS